MSGYLPEGGGGGAMKLLGLTDKEKKKLLCIPGPFQLDDVIDPEEFHFSHTSHSIAV